MDLDLLRTLVAVADSGGFTRAQMRIHRTQSTISWQIKRLEQELGRKLLDRSGRTVTLTEHGETLLHYARRMLDLESEARMVLQAPQKIILLRIGLPVDFVEFKLPVLLDDFAQRTGAARVEIVSAPSFELRTKLEHGELDLALVKEEQLKPGGHCYWQERLSWVVKAKSSVLAMRPLPLIAFPQGCPYRNRATAALDQKRTGWRIAYESSNWSCIKTAVESGLGIALIAETRTLSGVRVLGENDGFPKVDPVYIVLRARQAALRGPLAQFATMMMRWLPDERPVAEAITPEPSALLSSSA